MLCKTETTLLSILYLPLQVIWNLLSDKTMVVITAVFRLLYCYTYVQGMIINLYSYIKNMRLKDTKARAAYKGMAL